MDAETRKTVTFCGTEKAETPNAYLVFDGDNELWIPKSQVKERREIGVNKDNSRWKDCEYEITEWIAKKKEII